MPYHLTEGLPYQGPLGRSLFNFSSPKFECKSLQMSVSPSDLRIANLWKLQLKFTGGKVVQWFRCLGVEQVFLVGGDGEGGEGIG